MKKNYVLAFDFDGVIWNSVDECFYVGLKVMGEMDKLPFMVSDTACNTLLARFREGRFLAQSGEDFFVILQLALENPEIDFCRFSFEEFYWLRENFACEMAEFAQIFYQERRRMQGENLSGWLSLQGPYQDVLEQLPRLREEFMDLAICSTKDRNTINLLLGRYGQEYSVYGREFSRRKDEQMMALAEEKGVSPSRIIFIDDIFENLLQARNAGVIGVIADWGYNSPAQHRSAEKIGFPVISRSDLSGQLGEIVYALEMGGRRDDFIESY